MGLRELRHPVQGVRPAGHPAGRVREDRRRRAGPRVDRGGTVRSAAHPVGPGRGLRGAGEARRGSRVDVGCHQPEPVPGRRLPSRLVVSSIRRGPGEGGGAAARMHRHHGRHRLPRPVHLAGGRHQLSGAGRSERPPGPSRRGIGAGLRAVGAGPAAAARVQVLRAGVLCDRRSGLGDLSRPLRRPRAEGAGPRRHRAPRARDEHRVHRRGAAAGGAARRFPLQQQVLRRRRPHGRGGRTRSSCSAS